ncbi:helix-turn-helix domain-containing protein [Halotalea alkalilenta]|uniref:helix-turn-helix domain-containing protein n=1 Tax=Halotalea alkalilenta TaxID=376489 RepID=UPI00048024C2|nr:helix-turn-helix domain-containing protein [Halotalea alkalilenta]
MATEALCSQRLKQARVRFAEGEALPAQLLPDAVARSWDRSRKAGISPWSSPDYKALKPRDNPRAHPDDRRLIQCVRAEMEQLWAAFGGPHWTVFCVNPRGMIVHQYKGRDVPALLRPIQVGRRIQEMDVGTTAPSCVLAENQPIVLRGSQHYLSEFDTVFCLSVPLHGLEGELIGALDITGVGERDPELLLAHFRRAALATENRLIAGLRDCHIVRLRHDPRWTESPLQGLLAVDGDGQLRAANRIARRALGLPIAGAMPVLHVGELFAAARPAQRRRLLKPGAAQRLPLVDGTAVFVDLVRGASRPQPAVRSAPRQPDLREQTLQTVARRLRAYGGNVSATARELGISRTTLYKKIRALPDDDELT